ncbi:MAG: DUF302 domain-containing protein [Candidatus Eremiobacteraeota bacterium]|nr:DUF302 domain-containing protein [Candidatus Eremiobacteraeota bacterium]
MPFVRTQTSKTVDVRHVAIDSTKPFADVQTALEAVVPPLDPTISTLLTQGMSDELSGRLKNGPELAIFLKRDHGTLLGLYGEPRHAVQYEIGNPLTASTMTRYNLGAALYAPLRVVLYETNDGGSRFEYDLPSSIFGQFGDDRITEVGRGLDDALLRALSSASE